MTQKKRILVADREPGIQTVRNILGESCEIVPAHTYQAALDKLEQPLDLVVCGVHFDDSRMFDLVTEVKARQKNKRLEVLIFRDLESSLDVTFFRSLQISAQVLGAAGFVDLFDLKTKYGVAEADRQFHELLTNLTAAS